MCCHIICTFIEIYIHHSGIQLSSELAAANDLLMTVVLVKIICIPMIYTGLLLLLYQKYY